MKKLANLGFVALIAGLFSVTVLAEKPSYHQKVCK